MANNFSMVAYLALFGLLSPILAIGQLLAQETPEQRVACTQDTQRFCANAVPDIGRVLECLKARNGQLTRRCRTALSVAAPAVPPNAPRAPAETETPKAAATSSGPASATATQPAVPATAQKPTSSRPPHLAFAPHWRYTLRKPQTPLARRSGAPIRRRTMTEAERQIAARRILARRCQAAGRTYNPYFGTCGSGYFGGFFQ